MKKMNSIGSGNADDKAAQNPSSTKSMTLAMLKRREQLEDKRKGHEDKAQEDREREEKQNRVSINTVAQYGYS